MIAAKDPANKALTLLPIIISVIYVWTLKTYLHVDFSNTALIAAAIALAAVISINIFCLKQSFPTLEYNWQNSTQQANHSAVFILIALMIFMANSLRYCDILPSLLIGESNNTLDKANVLINRWGNGNLEEIKAAIHDIIGTYNWGLALIYAPLKSMVGDSQTTIKILTLSFWAGILGLFTATFCSWYRMRGVFILLLTPALVSTGLLMTARTYKWHVAAALASSALYFLVYLIQHQQNTNMCQKHPYSKIGIFLCTFILLLAVVMYHTTAIYIPILLTVTFINWLYSTPRRLGKTAVAISTILVLVFVGYVLWLIAPPASIAVVRFKAVVLDNADHTNLIDNTYSFFKIFFLAGSSWPIGALFLLGLSVGLLQWKQDIAARTILSGFFIILILLMTSYGATNLDENSFIVIPMIGVIFLGVRAAYIIFSQGGWTNGKSYIAAFVTMILLVMEAQQLYQYPAYNQEKDAWFYSGISVPIADSFANMLLIDAQHKKNAVVYFPDKEVDLYNGGIEDKTFYFLPETKRAMSGLRLFPSFYVLLAQIKQQLTADPKKMIFVYYNKQHLSNENNLEIINLEKIITAWAKEQEIPITVKNIVMPYPELWIWSAQLSYIAIYDNEHAAEANPSPEFNETNDPNEPMIDRVRRLARILRNNHTSNYF